MKYLIINADDFGLSPSVNKGIIEVFLKGNITSTSLMVNMPGFKNAIALAKRYPKLDVGLHFNLTYGSPISRTHVSSLIDGCGRFSTKKEWEERHVERELHAQWYKFCNTGLQPTHLDSHQLIQTYPNVFPCMVKFAKQYNVPMRLTVPKPIPLTHPITTNYLIGERYSSFNGEGKLKLKLKGLKHGVTELYCHPGYVDKYVLRYSHWTTKRERELRVFKQVNIRELCRTYGVMLVNYQDLYRIKNRRKSVKATPTKLNRTAGLIYQDNQ